MPAFTQDSSTLVLKPSQYFEGGDVSLSAQVVYWLLGSSVQKQALRDGERSPFPACKHSRVGVESNVVNSILMLEQRYFHVMEKLLVWLVFLPLSYG